MVVENYEKKQDFIRKFLEQRIEDNKELFTIDELTLIEGNINIIKKIYILGLLDNR